MNKYQINMALSALIALLSLVLIVVAWGSNTQFIFSEIVVHLSLLLFAFFLFRIASVRWAERLLADEKTF
jgi:hypothetical protein